MGSRLFGAGRCFCRFLPVFPLVHLSSQMVFAFVLTRFFTDFMSHNLLSCGMDAASLAKESAISLPYMSECPGTHCMVIEILNSLCIESAIWRMLRRSLVHDKGSLRASRADWESEKITISEVLKSVLILSWRCSREADIANTSAW